MKDQFDKNRDRLTDAEDRKIWAAVHDEIGRRRRGRAPWRWPAAVLATGAAAMVLAVFVMRDNDSIPDPYHFADRNVVVLGDSLNGKALPHQSLDDLPEETRRRLAMQDAPPTTESMTHEKAKAPGTLSEEVYEGEVMGKELTAGVKTDDEWSIDASETDVDPPAPDEADLVAEYQDSSLVRPDATGAIRGRVTSEDGTPLPYANVALDGTRLGTLTDDSGVFKILDVPAGTYTLTASFVGYEHEQIVDLRLDPGDAFAADIQMEPKRSSASRDTNAKASSVVLAQTIAPDPPTDRSWGQIKSFIEEGEVSTVYRGGRAGKAMQSVNAVPLDPGEGRPISVGGTDPVNDEAFDATFFKHYGVNPFIDAQDDPFATFAVDVDNASYSVTRAYLESGNLPPDEAVRVEEFVNAFKHDYAPPDEGTFAIHIDAAPSEFGENLTMLRVGLKGREVDALDRKPAMLTFVIDVSGSMRRADRLELVKDTLFELLDEMDEDDHVALVVYGTTARVILEHTSLAKRREIERAIMRLVPEGSTNAEAGLTEGYRLADRAYRNGYINRVILCSDGVANVGLTSAESILDQVKREARRGIMITSVGFGMSNFNDVLLEQIANQGDGNYYYVDDIEEARRVFVENLTGTLQTIAREVKIQVEFVPGTVRLYRFIGYENRDVADEDFRNDAVDAGEVGAGHEVTALFEVKMEMEPDSDRLATVRIRYEDPESGEVTEEVREFNLSDVREDIDLMDSTYKLDVLVAEFAEILRHSYWAREGDLDDVAELARDLEKDVSDREDVSEFADLVEKAADLWPGEEEPTRWRDDVRPRWTPDD